ncbi:MAG: 16S rRNA (cytidine(1402)-2'-O)-methyltransferase [Gammaproteobacteria bacterium]|nr:16S rRNA (cytidine(1402)-2'-O)-methyltransferase [Gammaproteobacteria bacterium]
MTALRNTGCLFVVATPIGNLSDITARAVDALKKVEIVACEDTRRCRTLLRQVGAVPAELVSLHDQNETAASRRVLARLEGGSDVALVSDAGTPLLSDPGFELVRLAFGEGIRVIPIPGVSAVTAAVSASPVATSRFTFEGFLPARPQRRRAVLSSMLARCEATVFFEAPHRIGDTLGDLLDLGAEEREIVVCRELTKMFETIVHGTVAEVADEIETHKGEFVCILAGVGEESPLLSAGEVLRVLLEELPPSRAARVAARLTGADRAELYRQAVTLTR